MQPVTAQPVLTHQIIPPQLQKFVVLLAKSTRLTCTQGNIYPAVSGVKFHLSEFQPCSRTGVICSLQRICSVSFPRSLIKTLNKNGPSINLRGTLVATSCQLTMFVTLCKEGQPLDVLNVDNTSQRARSNTVIGGHLRWLLAAGLGNLWFQQLLCRDKPKPYNKAWLKCVLKLGILPSD